MNYFLIYLAIGTSLFFIDYLNEKDTEAYQKTLQELTKFPKDIVYFVAVLMTIVFIVFWLPLLICDLLGISFLD